MAVRLEHMWQCLPMALVPLLFIIFQMVLVRIWMSDSPKPKREIPNYSLHVMREVPPKHIQRLMYQGHRVPRHYVYGRGGSGDDSGGYSMYKSGQADTTYGSGSYPTHGTYNSLPNFSDSRLSAQPF